MYKQCPLDHRFECHTDGSIRNVHTGRASKSCGRYRRNAGRQWPKSAHHMILRTFRPQGYHPLWMPWVDHIEGVRAGDQLSNLRWSNPVLNALNKRREPSCIIHTAYGKYVAQFFLLKHGMSRSFRTRAEAEACVAHVRPRIFKCLNILFRFLAARGGAPSSHKKFWKAAQDIYWRFPSDFWRRAGSCRKPLRYRTPYKTHSTKPRFDLARILKTLAVIAQGILWLLHEVPWGSLIIVPPVAES